jgi:hypothetical protein
LKYLELKFGTYGVKLGLVCDSLRHEVLAILGLKLNGCGHVPRSQLEGDFLLNVHIGVIQCLNYKLGEGCLLVLAMVALVLDLVSGDLMEVTNDGINLSNSSEVEDFQNRREVLLHVVVKKDLKVHRVEEGLGARSQREEVLGVTQADSWHLLRKGFLNIVRVFQIPDDVGWVDLTEPFNFRDSWGQVDAGVRHDRFVTPLCLPEEVRVQQVAAVILEELVGKTLLSIVDLPDHVLRADQISHVPISHVDALEQVVVLDQVINV